MDVISTDFAFLHFTVFLAQWVGQNWSEGRVFEFRCRLFFSDFVPETIQKNLPIFERLFSYTPLYNLTNRQLANSSKSYVIFNFIPKIIPKKNNFFKHQNPFRPISILVIRVARTLVYLGLFALSVCRSKNVSRLWFSSQWPWENTLQWTKIVQIVIIFFNRIHKFSCQFTHTITRTKKLRRKVHLPVIFFSKNFKCFLRKIALWASLAILVEFCCKRSSYLSIISINVIQLVRKRKFVFFCWMGNSRKIC